MLFAFCALTRRRSVSSVTLEQHQRPKFGREPIYKHRDRSALQQHIVQYVPRSLWYDIPALLRSSVSDVSPSPESTTSYTHSGHRRAPTAGSASHRGLLLLCVGRAVVVVVVVVVVGVGVGVVVVIVVVIDRGRIPLAAANGVPSERKRRLAD